MTAPKSTIRTTAVKRIQSVLSLCAIQLPHQILEDSPAVLITFELETRTSRRQQDRIARLCFGPRGRHSFLERAGTDDSRRAFRRC